MVEPKDDKPGARIEIRQFDLPFEGTRELGLVEIRVDLSIQMRAQIDNAIVEEYAESMSSGVKFPPIIVFADGETYRLADGFHRVEAAKRTGLKVIMAEVKSGGRPEALRYALGANAHHGLRRTNADKRRAVEIALKEFAALSDRAIADLCGVGNALVSEMRKQVCDSHSTAPRKGRDGKSYPPGKSPGQDNLGESIPAVKIPEKNGTKSSVAVSVLPLGAEASLLNGEHGTLPAGSETAGRTALSVTAASPHGGATAFHLADGREVTVNVPDGDKFLGAAKAQQLVGVILEVQSKKNKPVIVARQQHLTLAIMQALNEHAQVFPELTRGQLRQDLDSAHHFLRKLVRWRDSPSPTENAPTEPTAVALATGGGSAVVRGA